MPIKDLCRDHDRREGDEGWNQSVSAVVFVGFCLCGNMCFFETSICPMCVNVIECETMVPESVVLHRKRYWRSLRVCVVSKDANRSHVSTCLRRLRFACCQRTENGPLGPPSSPADNDTQSAPDGWQWRDRGCQMSNGKCLPPHPRCQPEKFSLHESSPDRTFLRRLWINLQPPPPPRPPIPPHPDSLMHPPLSTRRHRHLL